MKRVLQSMLKKIIWSLARKMGIQKKVTRYLNYVKIISINDVEIRISSIRGIACYASELWMIDLLAKFLPERSGVFIDVGVNVGQTLIKLKAIDPKENILALSQIQFVFLIFTISLRRMLLIIARCFPSDCSRKIVFYLWTSFQII